jgi:hypothetical protein
MVAGEEQQQAVVEEGEHQLWVLIVLIPMAQ